MTMTKKEIVLKINAEIGIPQNECAGIVDSLFQIMKDELANGNPVMISGFGKWGVLKKKARTGRNPKTGESITISARKVVTFRVSNALKNAMPQ
jgi:integration host factor subunit alpha